MFQSNSSPIERCVSDESGSRDDFSKHQGTKTYVFKLDVSEFGREENVLSNLRSASIPTF